MKSDIVLWLIFATLATVSLLSMMRRRQLQLALLLNEYVQRQLKWARCRAKAEVIAASEKSSATLAGPQLHQPTTDN